MGLDISLVMEYQEHPVTVFDRNYTHNVTPMWKLAGVYDALYNSHNKIAREVIQILLNGLRHMKEHPEQYLPLNPENKWGDYESACVFLEDVYRACRQFPDARIDIWR